MIYIFDNHVTTWNTINHLNRACQIQVGHLWNVKSLNWWLPWYLSVQRLLNDAVLVLTSDQAIIHDPLKILFQLTSVDMSWWSIEWKQQIFPWGPLTIFRCHWLFSDVPHTVDFFSFEATIAGTAVIESKEHSSLWPQENMHWHIRRLPWPLPATVSPPHGCHVPPLNHLICHQQIFHFSCV